MEARKSVRRMGSKKVAAYVLGVAILLALFLLFSRFIVSAALITSVIAVAIFTTVFRFSRYGLELATFATVIFGAAFGPKAGAIMGLVLILIQLLIGQYIDIYVLWVIPGYILLGYLAGVMGEPISTTGMVLAVGANAVFAFLTALINPVGLTRFLPYALFNSLLNVFLFSTIAPQVLVLMG